MKKYLFIINPVSGKGKGKKYLPQINDILEKSNLYSKIVLTEGPGHATQIVSEMSDEFDTVIAVGGDGTLNEVVNGIAPGADTIIGVIPIGSGNDFAMNLAMPPKIEECMDKILNSDGYKLCDICELEYKNGNSESIKKRFINNFGLGFDAQVAYINQHKKIGRGIISYIIAVLRALMDYAPIYYKLCFDNTIIEGNKLLLTFGNGTSSGGGFYLTPNAVIDDDLLDITTIEYVSRFKLLKKLPMALINKLETVDVAKMYKSKSAEISLNGPIYIHTDGEASRITTDKISVKIFDKKLRFITNL